MEVVEEFTVKTKRKEHPNARKYPGRPSMEFGTGLTKFLGDLDAAEREQFQAGTLVFEEEVAAEFFDSILAGDVIGVGLLNGLENVPCTYKFKVLNVNSEADTMSVRNVTWEDKKRRPEFEGETTELTFENLSCAVGMGFGEILERDGKPFGVSEDLEQVIKLVGNVSGSKEAERVLGKKQSKP
jgi:hypothetical protein